MNLQMIYDQHLIERYAAGRMQEDEADAFEQFYFQHPELAKEVLAAQALHAGMLEGMQYPEDSPAEASIPRSPPPPTPSRAASPGFFAIAATAALALGLGLLLRPTPQVSGVPAEPITMSISLAQYRSAASAPPVPHIAFSESGLALIGIDLGSRTLELPTALLLDGAGQEILRVRLYPDELNYTQVAVSSRMLAPGEYRLKVLSGEESQHEYQFVLETPET